MWRGPESVPVDDVELDALAQWPRLRDHVPDVRDGLTRAQRVVIWQLGELQRELGRESVPTALLYGRVIEQGVDLTPQQLSRLLGDLGARKRSS